MNIRFSDFWVSLLYTWFSNKRWGTKHLLSKNLKIILYILKIKNRQVIKIKTLIFNGSPKKNGNTTFLIDLLIKNLSGEKKVVNAYYENISACLDCNFCKKNLACFIDDSMTEVYKFLESSDNIVIASPIHFNQLTGKLLNVCSRFQKYFTLQKFFNIKLKPKKGAIILVSGGKSDPQNIYSLSTCILKQINANIIFNLVGSFNTDKIPANNDSIAIKNIYELANFFNNK